MLTLRNIGRLVLLQAITLQSVCPLSAASSCNGDVCHHDNDEVSLVQVNRALKIRHPAASDTDAAAELTDTPQKAIEEDPPMVEVDAEIESIPDELDPGTIIDVYKKNVGKVENAIAANTRAHINFDNEVRSERTLHKTVAKTEIEADKKAMAKAMKAKQESIKKAQAKRMAVEAKAQAKIDEAKADAEADDIKRMQTEGAAVEGRMVGAARGFEASAREIATQQRNLQNQAENKFIVQRHEAAIAHQKKIKEAINAETTRMAAADKAMAHVVGKQADDIIEHAEAEATAAKTNIEGPEGVKNDITKDNANWMKGKYEQQSKQDQARIEAAARAMWPKGNWPVVEPGTPPLVPGQSSTLGLNPPLPNEVGPA
jgi:hypothetical protein